MGLKTVTIQGRLVKDPESRQTRNNTSVVTFTVAVDSNRPARDGQKPPSSFFRVSIFGKRGESCANHLNKGDEVTVVGDLELDTYQGRDDKTYSTMQVTANEVFFGRKAQPKAEQQQMSTGQQAPPPQQNYQPQQQYSETPVY